ncbi:MAG: hypothetical protein ACKODX_02255, partial [Gemmata sp.]
RLLGRGRAGERQRADDREEQVAHVWRPFRRRLAAFRGGTSSIGALDAVAVAKLPERSGRSPQTRRLARLRRCWRVVAKG